MPTLSDIESVVAEREREILRSRIRDAVKSLEKRQAERAVSFLEERAELRRLEHGGSFVAVLWDDEWIPIDRAVEQLCENVAFPED